MTEIEHAAISPQPQQKSSGIKLVLPSLNAIKALKGKKKGAKGWGPDPSPVQKIPRPVKLKPLKEVLTKLILQIKKKDDYAFFLQPVDLSQIPGYTDLIKTPMDFGTITQKVDKGRYRSLEEFTTDVRLVTTNAKTFNPPGSIYYIEADRIEAFALSHISKAASQVIEYETDWNIDIERDDDGRPTEGDLDDSKGTPMDVDGSNRGRSPSVASVQTPVQGPGGRGRTNAKAGPSKKQSGMVSESWEDDGHLPGFKDGVGQFDPGSDFARLMLALKLKNKRYRTKKERMRMEKGGPPIAADGSLDYSEMEDPFTILSVFLPDPPSKPLLTPIWPTLPSADPEEPPLPGPINLSPDRPLYNPAISTTKRPPPDADGKRPPRRHWTITRSSGTRGKGKEKEEEEVIPAWKTPREPHTVDWGGYSFLVDKVACENGVRDVGNELGSVEKLLEAVKQRLERPKLEEYDIEAKLLPGTVPTVESYWEQKAKQAEDYVTDVVYGGVDGLAYVRSLAEFCTRPEGMEFDDSPPTYSALGKPLSQWVAENVVDHVTEGRHNLLRQASIRLLASEPNSPYSQITLDPTISRLTDLSHHLFPLMLRQLYDLKQIATHKLDMASLIQAPAELFLADDVWAGAEQLKEQKRKIEERDEEERKKKLELEEEKERKLKESPAENAAEYLAFAIKSHEEGELEVGGATGGSVKEKEESAVVRETSETIDHALKGGADMISKLSTSILGKRSRDMVKKEESEGTQEQEEGSESASDSGQDEDVKMEIDDDSSTKLNTDISSSDIQEEDNGPLLKKLRLNLLALAKRAPLDTVAILPADLVPPHIRAYVPTLATIPPNPSSAPSATASTSTPISATTSVPLQPTVISTSTSTPLTTGASVCASTPVYSVPTVPITPITVTPVIPLNAYSMSTAPTGPATSTTAFTSTAQASAAAGSTSTSTPIASLPPTSTSTSTSPV